MEVNSKIERYCIKIEKKKKKPAFKLTVTVSPRPK